MTHTHDLLTTTSSGATVPTFRVDRPDLTYRDPVLDRWGTSVLGGVVHRYATVVLDIDVDTSSGATDGLTRIDYYRGIWRDGHSRCAAAVYAADTTDDRPYSDTGCAVCLSLDGAPVRTDVVLDVDRGDIDAVVLDAARTCILDGTGDPDDCTTHNHAIDAAADIVPRSMCYVTDIDSYPVGTDAAADVARGRRAVSMYRYGTPSDVWYDLTLSDVVAAWRERHTAYWEDMTHVGRTIRSMARSRGWEHYYDRHMSTAIERADIPTVIRPYVERRTTVESGSGVATVWTDAVGYAPPVPPMSVTMVPHGAHMTDVLAAVVALDTSSAAALDAVADVLLDAADRYDWCTDYESSIERLHDGLSSYAMARGDVFHGREREHDYVVSGTVRITLDVPWSTIVTASSDDAASDSIDTDSIDVESAVREYAREMLDARPSYYGRSTFYDVDDIDVTDVESAS